MKPQSEEDAMSRDNRSPTGLSDGEVRVVDPSDAVTGMGFLFGAVGTVIGVISALILTPSFTAVTVFHCLPAGLAGASAGIVMGGMIGAIFAVVRGRRSIH